MLGRLKALASRAASVDVPGGPGSGSGQSEETPVSSEPEGRCRSGPTDKRRSSFAERKTMSLDSDDHGPTGTTDLRRSQGSNVSFKRKSLRRRSSKREKPEERNYGNSPEVYEEIRMRLLQEKAVVNGIEALQERWQMIMFMYHDCVDLNQGRIERHLSRLTVKRQEELIILATLFFLACLPVAGLMVLFVVAFR